MPDLVGTTVEDARASLAPFNVRLTVANEIDPAPAGTVIAQTPAAGLPFAVDVELVVSVAPPSVPGVVGLDVSAARALLTDMGFEIVESEVLSEQEPDGTIISQNPAEGTENAGTVVLEISRRPVIVLLRDLDSVASTGLRTGTYDANAVSYPDSLLAGGGDAIEYNLSRAYRQFVLDIGVSDVDASDAVMKISVAGDGRLLEERQVAFGTTESLDLDVTDVLRLRIDVEQVGGGSSRMVLGTPRLYGLEGEVPET